MMIGTPPKTEPSDTENHTPKLCINSLEETHNNSKENVDQLKWRSGQITIKQNHLIMLPEDWKLFRNAILIDQIDFHRVFSPLMVAIVTIKRLLVLVLEIGATILETAKKVPCPNCTKMIKKPHLAKHLKRCEAKEARSL